MISSKSEYFGLSRQLLLPTRCPVLERCERRAHTLALAAGWPLKEAADRAQLKTPVIRSVGEPAAQIGGPRNFVMKGLCPEVGLFETSYALIGLSGMPVTKGQYDKELDPQFEIKETGHFSECAEYSQYAQDAQKPVTGIPEKMTLKWLLDNVPVKLWWTAATLLLSVFAAGVAASKLGFVRDILQ